MPTRSRLHEAALANAGLGIKVFPCIEKGKRPACTNGFKDGTTDPAQIDAWWSENPNFNIGMVTGNGVVCLDVDQHDKDENGLATLVALEREHGGPIPELSGRQRTGSGGRHYLYRVDDGDPVKCSAGEIGPGLDVKGDGGYILVAPSVHPNGNEYAWVKPLVPPCDLEPCPAWLLTRMRTCKARAKAKAAPGAGPVDHTKEPRKRTMIALLGTLHNLLGSDAATAALPAINESRYANHPKGPLPSSVLDDMIKQSAINWASADHKSMTIELPTRQGLDDLAAKLFPKQVWVVERFFPTGGLAILAGRPKAGKSWFALQMAMAIAAGTAFLGRDKTCDQSGFRGYATTRGRVLYYGLEDSDRRMQARAVHKLQPDTNTMANMDFLYDLKLDQQGIATIDALLSHAREQERRPYELVVIDTFMAACLQRNGKTDPVRADYKEIQEVQHLGRKHDCLFILVCHARKEVSAGMPLDAVLGTTGVTAAADTIVTLRNGSEGELILSAIGKDTSLDSDLELDFDRNEKAVGPPFKFLRIFSGLKDESQEVYDSLVDDGPGTTAEIAKRTGRSANSTGKMLARIAKRGLIETTEDHVWRVIADEHAPF